MHAETERWKGLIVNIFHGRSAWVRWLSFAPVLLCVFVLSGCLSGPRPMVSLEADRHSSDAYQALVFGKVSLHRDALVVTDAPLTLMMWRVGGDPSPANWNAISVEMNSKAAMNNTVEVPFVLEVIPGNYDLRSIGFRSDKAGEERLYFHPKKGTTWEQGEKPQHQFHVMPNSLTYLGTIDIQVFEPEDRFITTDQGLGGFTYKLDFKNHFEHDVRMLQKRYPKLFSVYKKHVNLVFDGS
jgi:hypothetical protein